MSRLWVCYIITLFPKNKLYSINCWLQMSPIADDSVSDIILLSCCPSSPALCRSIKACVCLHRGWIEQMLSHHSSYPFSNCSSPASIHFPPQNEMFVVPLYWFISLHLLWLISLFLPVVSLQVGNLGLLFMLLFFIFAALGVELFGDLSKDTCTKKNLTCTFHSGHLIPPSVGFICLILIACWSLLIVSWKWSQ